MTVTSAPCGAAVFTTNNTQDLMEMLTGTWPTAWRLTKNVAIMSCAPGPTFISVTVNRQQRRLETQALMLGRSAFEKLTRLKATHQ
ncbi:MULTISPECIES: hypothetical protein [unclassified Bradyrhizobium]|uniref:hypothetical protein n=1 Tax=unclassified Bradyrhizobium TaxID=2631580 RepID=UPI0020B2AB30|nr:MULTISPECIES: hypothetical protein [unclassified Bradyrhizobium]MCP3380101.1 hypothetical protein [Bradyrhizobium sp. CCGUVB4N]MCP3380117.1 hypothetical protein [Bradyrhizobium sp. CCGUVB4N]MCP3440947.1 hypothetical protein [Bradyrhizobium sp. CCGUVB14]MCP3440989.1 hypothetical protein [Bradyrhizobium sp. CCGUVB14]